MILYRKLYIYYIDNNIPFHLSETSPASPLLSAPIISPSIIHVRVHILDLIYRIHCHILLKAFGPITYVI